MRNRLRYRLTELALVVVAMPVLNANAAEKRAFGIEDVYRAKSLESLSVSRDGKLAVYAVNTKDLARATSQDDIRLLDLSSGSSRPLTVTADKNESNPVMSPDGKTVAFVSDRGGVNALWLLPLAGGEARELLRFHAGISGLLWSPTGTAIAFSSDVFPSCGADDACNARLAGWQTNGPLKAHVADELLLRHWTEWDDGKRTHIMIAEIATGTVRDLTPGDREAPTFALDAPRAYDFSPDGSLLAYAQNPDSPETLALSTNVDVMVVPVAFDAEGHPQPAQNITAANQAFDGTPRFSPDGRYIAYRTQATPGYESDLFRVALYDCQTQQTRPLTSGFDNWVDNIAWSRDSKSVVFLGQFQGRNPLWRVGLDGKPVLKVADFAHIDEYELSPDGASAYAIRRSVAQPWEVWRLSIDDSNAAPKRLTTHNLALENDVDIRPVETLWIEGAAGRKIQTFIVKPHSFDPSKTYPLILNVHGGPQGSWDDSFRGDWQVYPGAGYVVAFANPTGSTGFGQAFVDAIGDQWGGAVYEDLMHVTDALVQLPYVDKERTGAMGWSYGGYMMNWFQGHTTRFKCLANMMGIFDLPSFYGGTEELWFPEKDLSGRPWDSEQYQKWNPAAFVKNWQTPMLVVSGERDFRVPYYQGVAAHTTLRRNGIPSRLVVLPTDGHWPKWYSMVLYYTAHIDWFHRWLGGEAAPWSVEDFAFNRVFDPATGKKR